MTPAPTSAPRGSPTLLRPLSSWRLSLHFVRHRWDHALLLAALAALLGALVVGTASVRDSARSAIEESLRADLGGRTYALQSTDPTLAAELDNDTSAAPVLDELAEITHAGRAAPVVLRTTDDPTMHLGLLDSGERPGQPGQAMVGWRLASDLGVEVGETVTIVDAGGSEDIAVVGLLRDPADAQADTVILLVDESQMREASRWLLNDLQALDREPVRTLMDARAGTVASIDSLLQAADLQASTVLAGLRALPLGLGLVMMLVLGGTVASLGRTWSRDVATLRSLGLPSRSAWRALGGGMLSVSIVAVILGGATALGGVHLLRRWVSGWLGQDWSHITVPYVDGGIVVGVVLALGVFPLLIRTIPWRGVMSRLSPRVQDVGRRWPGWSILVVGVLALLAGAWAVDAVGDGAALLAPAGAVLAAASLPLVLSPAAASGLSPARRVLTRRMARSLSPVVIATVVVAALGSLWTAHTTYTANRTEALDNPMMPPGSFVISEVPQAMIPTLTELYRDRGGRDIVTFATLGEQQTRVRVMTPTMARCAEEYGQLTDLPPECWPPLDSPVAAPINVVMLSAPGTPAQADRGLIENGEVGLVMIDSTDRSGQVRETSTLKVVPGADLGGLLPGLVLGADDPTVDILGLAPSGSSLVVLKDFHAVQPAERFEMRALILTLMPTAEVADGTNTSFYDRQRSAATMVSLTSGALSAAVLLVGGMAQIVGDRVTRRTVRDLAVRSRPLWTTAARWAAVPAGSLLLMLPLAWTGASYAGLARDASYGWMWILPGIIPLGSVLALVFAFLRVPDRVVD